MLPQIRDASYTPVHPFEHFPIVGGFAIVWRLVFACGGVEVAVSESVVTSFRLLLNDVAAARGASDVSSSSTSMAALIGI